MNIKDLMAKCRKSPLTGKLNSHSCDEIYNTGKKSINIYKHMYLDIEYEIIHFSGTQ